MQYFYIVVYTIVGDDLTMWDAFEANRGADMNIDICR